MWEREREATDAIAAQIAAAEQLASPAAHDGGATSSHTAGVVYGIPVAPAVGAGHRTTSTTTVPWHDPADPLVGRGSAPPSGWECPEHSPDGPRRPGARVAILRSLAGPAPPHPSSLRPGRPRPLRPHRRGTDRRVGAPRQHRARLDRGDDLCRPPQPPLEPSSRSGCLAGHRGPVPGQRRGPGSPPRRGLPHLRPGGSQRQLVLPQDEDHGGVTWRSGLPREGPRPRPQLLRGLSDRYTHLQSLIMRQRPFPTFLQVRDDLALEITLDAQAASISGPGSSSSSTALAATNPTHPPGPSGGSGARGGRGGGGGGRRRRGGRGGGGGSGGGGGARGNAPTPGPQQGVPWPTFHHPWSGRISMWSFQGSGSEARPPAAMFVGAQPGFTSPPGFAFASPSPWTSTPAASSWPTSPTAPPSGPVGWDAATLAATFQTPTLTPPMGPKWIADTGATYHITPDHGILTSVHPPSSSLPSYIMVANGSCLPVTSVGVAGTPDSFRIPDVLVAPLVHNLLSIRRFTADNSCSVELDSSGLTVKDSATRRPLLRCDSTGPLYTLRLPHATSSSSSSSDAATGFAATTPSTTWQSPWSPRTRCLDAAYS
jgi:hypothetical protein